MLRGGGGKGGGQGRREAHTYGRTGEWGKGSWGGGVAPRMASLLDAFEAARLRSAPAACCAASTGVPGRSSATSGGMPPASRMTSWLVALPAARFHSAPAACCAAAAPSPPWSSATSGGMPPASRIASCSAVVLLARFASAPAACCAPRAPDVLIAVLIAVLVEAAAAVSAVGRGSWSIRTSGGTPPSRRMRSLFSGLSAARLRSAPAASRAASSHQPLFTPPSSRADSSHQPLFTPPSSRAASGCHGTVTSSSRTRRAMPPASRTACWFAAELAARDQRAPAAWAASSGQKALQDSPEPAAAAPGGAAAQANAGRPPPTAGGGHWTCAIRRGTPPATRIASWLSGVCAASDHRALTTVDARSEGQAAAKGTRPPSSRSSPTISGMAPPSRTACLLDCTSAMLTSSSIGPPAATSLATSAASTKRPAAAEKRALPMAATSNCSLACCAASTDMGGASSPPSLAAKLTVRLRFRLVLSAIVEESARV